LYQAAARWVLSEALNIGNEVGLLVGLRDSKPAESKHRDEHQVVLCWSSASKLHIFTSVILCESFEL
jgi:hypothetical protein